MSAFREAAATMIQSDLVCPGCHAMNRPGVIYIEVSPDWERAVCIVCSHSGPIARFHPTERTA